METDCLEPDLATQENLHPFEPGDWIWIKSFIWKSPLLPKWKRPFQILLTTQTAVKVSENGTWTHWTHGKPAVFDHSTEPDPTQKVPLLKLQRNPEIDEWAEKWDLALTLCIIYPANHLSDWKTNLFLDKGNVWNYLVRKMLKTTNFF